MSSFEFTAQKVELNVHISAIAAGVSILACGTVLGLAAWVWSVPSARHHLDRVSFRLLLWSLAWEVVYDVNYIASVLGSKPNAGCAVGIYFMIGTLGVVNYLCTAIAVNLAITIVLGFNPIMLKLERWYVGVSMFVGLFVPIVPAALGHFGWDPLFQVCWIKADNDKERVRNFVLDLYLWQILSCVIASVAVIATLIKLFRQGRATSRALFGGDSMNLDMSANSWDDEKTPRKNLIQRAVGRRRNSVDKQRMFGHLEDRFTSIALRISTYPVALIVVNGIITVGDLYISASGGVHSQSTYILYCVYYFLYGARGIVFVALSLFVDPCLWRGVRTAWEFRQSQRAQRIQERMWLPSDPDGEVAPGHTDLDPSMPAAPEQAHVNDSARRASVESDKSLDMMQALFSAGPPGHPSGAPTPTHSHVPHMSFPHPHMPHLPHPHMPHLPSLPWFLKRHVKAQVPKDEEEAAVREAFPGVAALPEGMVGGADDVVLPEYLEAKAEADMLHRAIYSSPHESPHGTPTSPRSPPSTPIPSGAMGRRGSVASALSGEVSHHEGPGSKRDSMSAAGSVTGVTAPPGLRWTPSVRGSVRGSVGRNSIEPRSPLAAIDEQRMRREVAMEIAERLYEEMEAQL